MTEYRKLQRVIFPEKDEREWRDSLLSTLKNFEKGVIEVDTQDWYLTCNDLKELQNICNNLSLKVIHIQSSIPETIVSASALGISSRLLMQKNNNEAFLLDDNASVNPLKTKLFLHNGTLRSGERLETDGDLLVLGDINPGAIVLAGGNVMIWGRLLGIAHAGKDGNINARITALQLRPLQIRIASQIARGPKERPEEGYAEQAIIEKGLIVIKPASTKNIPS